MARVKTDAAQAAKIIRTHLKDNGVPARVTCRTYSQGSSVDVVLFDPMPATKALVEKFTTAYAWERNHNADLPQARFVMITCNFSHDMKQAAKRFVTDNFNAEHYSRDEIEHTLPYQVLTGYQDSRFWTDRKPRVTA